MVNKLTTINLVAGVILLLSSSIGIYDTYKNVIQYGWTYDQTTIINGNSNTDFVNNYAQLFSILLVFSLGILFLINRNTFTSSISTTSLDNLTGITFPNIEPEYWLIEHSPSNNLILVGLGEYSIEFPLSMVLKEDPE